MPEKKIEAAERNFGFARRIVIKVGTSILRGPDAGIDRGCIRAIASQVAAVRAAPRGRQVVVISSGAVGFGMMKLGMTRRPADVASLQAVASVGQPLLMRAWAEAFEPHGIAVSQLLLTNDGLQERRRFVNAKNAITRVIDLNVLPIVNENDTVAVEELTFGDNDRLSAMVAAMVDADLLVILTDVEGFYDPTSGSGVRRILNTVREIRPEWVAATAKVDRRQKRGFTVGGMSAKLSAASIALTSGIPVVIASGRDGSALQAVLAGDPVGTLFVPGDRSRKGKKTWLSIFPHIDGAIIVDRGAVAAIMKNGKSLLPSGISRVEGRFSRKGCVSVESEDGVKIARGISNYSAEEVALIAGHPSAAIRARLNISDADAAPPEVIHRDNLSLLT